MVGAKRSYGSGSIRERSPSVWQLRVKAGHDPVTGKPRTVSETFHGGKKAAQQRLAELVAQHSSGITATKATLGSLIERWMTTARLEPGTVRNYRNALRHLPAPLLSTPLNQVGAHELDSVYSALSRSGLGAPTIRVLHAVLSAALQQAVKWRWIPANPARSASPPAARRGRSSAPDSATLAALITAAQEKDPQFHLWLRLAIVTGARRGEVLALRWGDLTGDRLTISGSIDYDRTRKGTKTGDPRAVTVDPGTVALVALWQRMARERALTVGHRIGRGNYILSDEADFSRPWRPDVASKRFRRLCIATGVSGVRLHDLRHAHASQLLSDGVDLATVSRRLGHSRTSTTADIYAHVMPGADERAAVIAAQALP